jgi:hypothetical protein
VGRDAIRQAPGEKSDPQERDEQEVKGHVRGDDVAPDQKRERHVEEQARRKIAVAIGLAVGGVELLRGHGVGSTRR